MRLAAAFWALAAVLACFVAALWLSPSGPAPAARAPIPQAASAAQAAREPVDAWAAAVLARPLFNPDRRPDPAAADPGTPTGPQAGLPRLAGIMLTRGSRRAIFAAAGAGKATVAAEGATIGDWRIEAIDASGVRLAGPAGERLVRPSYSDAPPAATSVAPRPPPPLLPPPPAETGPFSASLAPSGAAIFLNAPTSPPLPSTLPSTPPSTPPPLPSTPLRTPP